MLPQVLKLSFDKYFEAPIGAWQQFADLCESVTFAKDDIIKAVDARERYFYFILKGSAGIFLWSKHNFVCLDFAFDHSFCGDYMSLLTRQPTPLQVVALEDADMVRITSSDFYHLSETPVGRVIMQVSAESSFVDKQQQQIELLTRTAEERYQVLTDRYPDIHQRVAQKHIASYLGITPQSLSRIRKAR